MTLTDEQRQKLDKAQEILQYRFEDEHFLLSAITHPSATEGKSVRYSYERLEFLGDSILGAIVAMEAFTRYEDIDEGGLTRIKVALVSGSHLSEVSEELGVADIIVFGSSEAGTGRRGLHSALENVYEALVAALCLDGGMEVARAFVERTLIPRMSLSMAKEVENPKSALQEKLQEDGITPTYKLIDTQGPPHDRTFVAQVYAGDVGLAQGVGRTKKEAESQAAKSTLARLSEFLGLGLDAEQRAIKASEQAQAKARKTAEQAHAKAAKTAEQAHAKAAKTAEQALAKADKTTAQQAAKAAKAKEKARLKSEREAAKSGKPQPRLEEGSDPDATYEVPDTEFGE